jgi:protein-tyrosine phosphatase
MNAQMQPALRPAPFPRRAARAGRADIHFHLLPGVDDGPADMDEAVDLAILASMEGTATIVATPHVRGDFITDVSDLPDRVREVREAIADEGVDLEVLLGAELGHDMVGRLDQAELELLATGPPGARWLLVEAPFTGFDWEFAAATRELRERGFACVVAHPERALAALDDDCAALSAQVAEGAVLQLNAMSLDGRHGSAPQAAAVEMMWRFPCVVSSDAHGRRRTPALSVGLRAAITCGSRHDAAHRMVDAGPRTLVRDGLAVRLASAA